MNYSYRITKYHAYIEGTSYLTSSPEEWQDYSDVGGRVSLQEYMRVETQYVEVVLALIAMAGITSFRKILWKTELLDEDEVPYIEGDLVDGAADVAKAVRHFLRYGGGKLVALNGRVEIHFGWDFYLYVVCDVPYTRVIGQLDTPLNVEAFRSPYLDDMEN